MRAIPNNFKKDDYKKKKKKWRTTSANLNPFYAPNPDFFPRASDESHFPSRLATSATGMDEQHIATKCGQ